METKTKTPTKPETPALATAIATSLPISTKQSVEICSFIRNKTTDKARKLLEQVLEKKIAIPYKRYTGDVGHKRGKIAAGRYPLKAIFAILKLLKAAEANAGIKGLSTPLLIKEIISSQASRNWHFGRHRRRKTKRTHIKITLQETKKEETKKETKKPTKQKQEQKKEQKK